MNKGNELSCPHCINNVPWGTTVCHGCHAEIKYGTPTVIGVTLAVLSLVAGGAVALFFINLLPIKNIMALFIISGAITLLGWLLSFIFCSHRYRNRASFNRIYKT